MTNFANKNPSTGEDLENHLADECTLSERNSRVRTSGEHTSDMRTSNDRTSLDKFFMREAIHQAHLAESAGEVPIGAVVVYDPIDPATRKHINSNPEIIAQAFNTRETTKNPAGHAEFQAMLQASRKLDAWRLTGCSVYVTLEPCIMCAGLMHQTRIDRCVFGASDPKAGATGSLYRIHEDTRLNHTFSVTSGVLEQECANLLRQFFRCHRKARKSAKQSKKPQNEEK